MSRRARAAGLAAGAIACAAAAASLAGSYRSAAEAQLGELRPAVLTKRELPAGGRIGPREARSALAVRRIPLRFVPPGTLISPEQAIGLEPAAAIPAKAYVLAAQLTPPSAESSRVPGVGAGRRAVEVLVSGGGALGVGGAADGGRVDVVVAEQRGPGTAARTYIAASGVRLLALRPPAPGSAGRWSATLALTRRQALRLIEAESFARQIRLLARS